MTRLVAAGTPDTVATAATEETRVPNSATAVRYALIVPRQPHTAWLAQTSGTQLVDLLLDVDGTALAGGVVTADNNGLIPAFRLPDGLVVDGVWLDPVDASADRFWVPIRFGPSQATAAIATQLPAALAADPTIQAAATAAATAAIAARNLVARGDFGVGIAQPADGILIALTDSDGTRTWLEVRDTDGSLTDYAAGLVGGRVAAPVGAALGVVQQDADGLSFGITDASGYRTWLEANDVDGGPTSRVLALLASAIGVGVGAVTLATLAPEVIARLAPLQTPTWLPEITGTTGSRQLWSRAVHTGERLQLVTAGDPSAPVATPDGWIHFTTGGAEKAVRCKAGSPVVAPFADLTKLTGWGDSLTKGGGSLPVSDPSKAWPGQLATLRPDLTVTNEGVSSETTDEIAIRQGGVVLYLTGTIPAGTTQAAMTATVPPVLSPLGNVLDQDGTLAGIHGHLSRTGTQLYFQRSTAGTSTPVTAAAFTSDDAVAHGGEITVLWPGRNDIVAGPDTPVGTISARIIDRTAKMVDAVAAHGKAYLVLGCTNSASEARGSGHWQECVNVAASGAATYGTRFIDIRRYLIDSGLAAAGITPTTGDLSDIANDLIPRSLRTNDGTYFDGVHFSETCYLVIAKRIRDQMLLEGWIS